ncbi:NYN domain-containing protein [uncultured Sphingomonas sp.]|uniref:NYN domain-containing protein n=1 Tax=uncultured Sphingomonas sp. TaxID=158754 RepID=UPI0035CA13AA
MMQTAVFVDAGYLLAQGGSLLAGSKVSRQRITLHVDAAITLLTEIAATAAPGARLLRVYWYDGLVRGGSQTAEHIALGRAANVKLRLGMVNSRGEQKGVDSLIVTDMIELARNEAISDAVILSGDEDIRVGLQVAQTYGVRVQLVGVKPALGSQSPDLVAEADTHLELDEVKVGPLITIAAVQRAAVERHDDVQPGGFAAVADRLAIELIGGLGDQRLALLAYADANRGALPSDFDRPALAKLRDRLGRDVGTDERKTFRTLLRNGLKQA